MVEAIDIGDQLGEGVLWRGSDQTLWWTDILGSRIHRFDWATQRLQTFPTPERLGSFGFVEGDDNRLVAAFETGFALFRPASGERQWLARPEALSRSGRRLNDGRVGPDGRFWAGSMLERERSERLAANTGLYRLGNDGAAHFVRGGFTISNGICWSPDGRVMYMTDTPSRKIVKCAYDPATGGIAASKPYADVADGFPDGAVTDRDGNLWTALWGAAKIACFDERGVLACEIAVPALQPTCPAFAGPERSLLAVSTAAAEMSDAELEAYPRSGSLLIYEGRFAGWPSTRYRHSPLPER